MLKKTIKYEDFDGNEVEEDLYFNLTKAELVELELGVSGGLSEWLKRIVASEDMPSIIAEFKKIILTAYGKRSEDGRRFIKNQEIRDEFASTEAYSAFFMEVLTDEDVAAEFVNGIIPANLAEEAAKIARAQAAKDQLAAAPDKNPELETVSRAEVEEMSQEEVLALGERVAKGEAKIAD